MSLSRRTIIIISILVLTAGSALALWGYKTYVQTPENERPVPYLPKATGEEQVTTPEISEEELPQEEPQPRQSETGELTISTPTNGATVSQGTEIKGTAKTFNNTLYVLIKSMQKGQLGQFTIPLPGSTTQVKPYSFDLAFEKEPVPGDRGTIEVYTLNNGVKADSAILNVVFE